MKCFYYLFILLLPVITYSQQRYPMNAAGKAYAAMKYADAIFYYKKALKKDSLNSVAMAHLAESYFKTQQYSAALKWYEKVLKQPAADTFGYYRYAQLLAMDGRYREAAAAYRQCRDKGWGDEHLSATIALYEQGAAALLKDTAAVKIELLNINSGYADFCPVFHRYGLLFLSDRPVTRAFRRISGWNGGSFLTLYQVADTANVRNAALRTPELAARLSYAPRDVHNTDNSRNSSNDSRKIGANPQLNFVPVPNQLSAKLVTPYDLRMENHYHTGPIAFNKKQDTLFLTRNQPGWNGADVNRLQLDVFVARRDHWELLPLLPFNSASYSTGQPALHPDGHVLFFASDMPGGFGGKDIYYVMRTDSGWGTPVNAGPNVNTAGDEMFPYVAATGRLYFSSDRWPGLGGLDIFSVQLDTGYQAVGAPENAGAPVNSSRNDFGILLYDQGRKGFISSDRRGNDDIYGFSLSSPISPSSLSAWIHHPARQPRGSSLQYSDK